MQEASNRLKPEMKVRVKAGVAPIGAAVNAELPQSRGR